MFRHIEVGVEAAQILQSGNFGAAGEVVADVDLTDADGAAERCEDAFFRQRCVELIDRGPLFLQNRRESVVFTFGNGATVDQLAATPEVQLRQTQVGFGGLQQSGFNGAVELQQRLPGLDLLS